MAEQTNISWADATLNFWIGCTKVSPACDHCYAETWGNRFGVKWGPKEARRRTVKNLAKARKIQRKGILDKQRQFVFSNSLSDIFDNAVPIDWLADALEIMRATPHNVYLLLTKRPQNIVKRIREVAEASLGPYADEEGVRSFFPKNIALLCTVVNQKEADRDVPKLLEAKRILRPIFVGLSMEPLLGSVDLTRIHPLGWPTAGGIRYDALRGQMEPPHLKTGATWGDERVDWVITGGESGAYARPSNPNWFRSLRDQCAKAEVAYHHKQNGEFAEPRVTPFVPVSAKPVEAHVFTEQGLNRIQHITGRVDRVGKAVAGRKLDGVIHDARPKVAA